jgi:hypothetical protein
MQGHKEHEGIRQVHNAVLLCVRRGSLRVLCDLGFRNVQKDDATTMAVTYSLLLTPGRCGKSEYHPVHKLTMFEARLRNGIPQSMNNLATNLLNNMAILLLKGSVRNAIALALAILLITGCDPHEPAPAVLNWKQLPEFPGGGRRNAVGFWIGDNFYTGLGDGVLDGNPQVIGMLNDFYEYGAVSNTWTKKADFPGTRRSYPLNFSIGGKGYVGFGVSSACTPFCGPVYFNDLWEYNPATNAWTLVKTYPDISGSHAQAHEIGGKIYAGFNNSATLYAFDPADNSLAMVFDTPPSR